MLVVDCSFRRLHQVVIHHHSRFFLSASQCLNEFEGIKKADDRGTVAPRHPHWNYLWLTSRRLFLILFPFPKLPQPLTTFEAEAVDHPAMLIGWRVLLIASKIEPFLDRLLLAGANCRAEEDLVSPDNWRGPTSTGHWDAPLHVFRRTPSSWEFFPSATPRAPGPRNCGQWVVSSARYRIIILSLQRFRN